MGRREGTPSGYKFSAILCHWDGVDRPGWDGIETEGLCYIADQVYGGKNCFGLPNVVASTMLVDETSNMF